MSLHFKIGLYVRVSTEEQAENPEGSIKNQEERLREFVKLKNFASPFGEITEVFVDAGISAKDMRRPALQRLLRKVETKEIDLILVTELSRFTRSIKDFSSLWEFLDQHKCKFLSIKDNFDTSTAAGELVMFMMASIAQFERKQTAERISYSFLARAKRGLHNGGSVPLGYKIDKERSGNLKVVPEQAEVIRLVFKTFLAEETLAKTAKAMNEMKIELPATITGRGRTGIFRLDMVHHILRNKAYVGLRAFKSKDSEESVVKAAWEAIVDDDIFEKAQKLLSKNRYVKRSHLDQRYPYTLSGVCYCQHCGDRMSGKSAHGRNGKVGYYEHNKKSKHQASLGPRQKHCDPFRVQAAKLEPEVWRRVKHFLLDEQKTREILGLAKAASPEGEKKNECDQIKKKTRSTENQMEALVERISRLPKGFDDTLFIKKLENLQRIKSELEVRLLQMENEAPSDIVIPFHDFTKFTEHLRGLLKDADQKPELQTAIARKLVNRIEITPRGFEIEFFVGKEHLSRELRTKTFSSVGLRDREPTDLFLKISGSRRLTNGGPRGT
jgi:site-specific DNA recombinase